MVRLWYTTKAMEMQLHTSNFSGRASFSTFSEIVQPAHDHFSNFYSMVRIQDKDGEYITKYSLHHCNLDQHPNTCYQHNRPPLQHQPTASIHHRPQNDRYYTNYINN